MKSVQDVDRVACFLEDHLEVRLPHVAAYELQLFGPVLAEEAKETQQCFGRSVWSDPEQSLATFIDLVNQRRVLMAAMPLHFVNADRFDFL